MFLRSTLFNYIRSLKSICNVLEPVKKPLLTPMFIVLDAHGY